MADAQQPLPDVSSPPPNYLPLAIFIGACQMIVTMDLITMGVLLPSIGESLRVGPERIGGLIGFSSLVFASMLLVGGRLADLFGQRNCLGFGLATAAAGAVLSASASSYEVLLAGRVLFGLGAAVLVPANFSLINTVIPEGHWRARAFGIFGIAQGIAMFVGPSAGGFLATSFGWNSVFWAVAVFVAVLLICCRRLVQPVAASGHTGFDWTGTLLFVPALTLLVVGIGGGSGLLSSATERVVAAAGGAALLLLFAFSQKGKPNALLPLDVFRYQGTGLRLFAMFAVMTASSGLFILPSLVMQQSLGFSAAEAGTGMVPHSVAGIIAGQMIGWFMMRFTLRRNVLIGFSALFAGTLLNGFMQADFGYLLNILIPMLIAAAGSIFTVTMLMAAIAQPYPEARQGVMSAVIFTCQQIGVALGSVLLLNLANSATSPMAGANLGFLTMAAIAATGAAAFILARSPQSASQSAKMEG